MKTRRLQLITGITLILVCSATAQTVYKSVDAQGKVTYSSSPPSEAVDEAITEVPIVPGPSREQQKAASDRAKEIDDALRREEMKRQRETDQTKDKVSRAKDDLRSAEAALEQARVKGRSDRQFRAGGGFSMKPEYHERVRQAEEKVEEAKKALRDARSGNS